MKNTNEIIDEFSIQELESRLEMKEWVRIRVCSNSCPAK
jgi:hypothetical protein